MSVSALPWMVADPSLNLPAEPVSSSHQGTWVSMVPWQEPVSLGQEHICPSGLKCRQAICLKLPLLHFHPSYLSGTTLPSHGLSRVTVHLQVPGRVCREASLPHISVSTPQWERLLSSVLPNSIPDSLSWVIRFPFPEKRGYAVAREPARIIPLSAPAGTCARCRKTTVAFLCFWTFSLSYIRSSPRLATTCCTI